MNDIKQKIEAEIQFAIENDRTCVTITLDNVTNDDLSKIISSISTQNRYIRVNRCGDKTYLYVYTMLKNN